jgi:Transglutaminase-like superfamily
MDTARRGPPGAGRGGTRAPCICSTRIGRVRHRGEADADRQRVDRRLRRHAGHDDVRPKRVRLDAVCAAAVALVAARVWLVLAPGQAVRWGSRIGEPAPGLRGLLEAFTGLGLRRSGEGLTERGLRGSHFAHSGFFPFVDPQDPRPAEDPRGPRRVENLSDPRNPRPVENLRDPRDPRPVENLGDPRDPRPVENPRAPLPDARIRDLSRAVIVLGARPPLSATCLEQSLALVMLLSIARIPAHLLVGVARLGSNLRAHAWVECCGDVVLGGAQAEGLAPLLRAPATSSSPAASSCPG